MFFLCGRGHLSSSILHFSRCQRPCRSTGPKTVLLITYVLDFWIIAVFCLQACNRQTEYISCAVKFGHFLAVRDDWAEGTDGAVSACCCKFRPPKVDTVAINVSISDISINIEKKTFQKARRSGTMIVNCGTWDEPNRDARTYFGSSVFTKNDRSCLGCSEPF